MLAYKEQEGTNRMPSNGEVNTEVGVYKTLCCDAVIEITAGTAFPDCPNHPKLPTVWKRIRAGQNMARSATDEAA